MSTPEDPVVVVGVGASSLIPVLLDEGYHGLVAIDIAEAALAQLADRLVSRATLVTTVCADVRAVELGRQVAVWHDRATFHFLTEPDDQQRYAERAASAVRPGGHLIVATFAPDGPTACSELPVCGHDPGSLSRVFARWFTLVESFRTEHVTPWGTTQPFTHALFRREFEPAALSAR